MKPHVFPIPLLLVAMLLSAGCASERSRSMTPGTLAAGPGGAARDRHTELWIITRAEAGHDEGAGNLPMGLARVAADDADQPLPLTAATVRAQVRGLTCDVALTQRFANPHDEPINAVYRFPLPNDARVRGFTMVIGQRRVRGIFREPEEARRLYVAARWQGHRASLLTVGRDHVLTHRIANIEPRKAIDIDLTYRHTLERMDDGYRFVFPALGVATKLEPAAIDVVVALRPGAPLVDLASASHVILHERLDADVSRVTLADADGAIAVQPFELWFRVADDARLTRAADHDEPSPHGGDDAVIAVDATAPHGP